jgi:hypothetical protein
MTKYWLIAFLIAGSFGGNAFADCVPAPGTPASVIEYFQKANKPLPEQFCAKDADPQASYESPEESSQAGQAPDRGDDGSGDTSANQYESDDGGGYESDQNYQDDQENGDDRDRGDGYQDDQEGDYERDRGGGYRDNQEGDYEGDYEGGYERDRGGNYQNDGDYDDDWGNDDRGDHGGKKHKKGGGKNKKKKGHGKAKAACKKAHMKWNDETKTCKKRN